MPESNHIYIVYKTTNLVNKKIYIGVHRQEFYFPILFDGYFGSGVTLKQAIKKYGPENFIRKTLYVYYTSEAAYAKERELVNEDFINQKQTYNMKPGGYGTSIHSKETKRKIGESLTGRIGGMKNKKHSPETKLKMSESRKGENNIMYGKPKSAEVKQKLSKSLKGRKQSEEVVNKRVKANTGKKRKLVQCPHCNKIGGVNAMKRWHFNNCPSFSDSLAPSV